MGYEALTFFSAVGLLALYMTRPPTLLALALMLLHGTTHAQTVPARDAMVRASHDVDLARLASRTEHAVLLARMAWLEAGAHVQAGELAAMHEVIVTRTPSGSSYQRTAYQYSSALRNPRRMSVHRLGRATLGAGWPAVYREHWPRVLAAADAAIAGTLRHGCDVDTPLRHFGGPHVDRSNISRLLTMGYAVAACPDGYANTFLTRAE